MSSINSQESRRRKRFDRLIADDAQFAAARPDPRVTQAVADPDVRLTDLIRTVMTGYADRPALGQRAVDFVTGADGRTRSVLRPWFDTLTYAEVFRRAQGLASVLAGHTVDVDDRVAILGFTSSDYVIVDVASALAGAVVVPLQTRAPVDQHRQIVVETAPVAMFASVEHLADVAELVRSAPTVQKVVAFDYHPADDDHRESYEAAAAALGDIGVDLVSLDDAIAQAAVGGDFPDVKSADAESLRLLIYTSGSTGTPKGAMYTDKLTAKCWRNGLTPAWDTEGQMPSITLNLLPLSHIMGRLVLYSTLGSGGTAYFTAKSDLSTMLDDLALVRPTRLELVPRIWETLFREVQREVDHQWTEGDRTTVEKRVMADECERLIGGRQFSAFTASAPISAELRSWLERFVDVDVVDGYGSTEGGVLIVDDVVRRPPVLDYKLVDVPELNYFSTDWPHPRGELWVKTADPILGYYHRPDVTAGLFDSEGWYHTGDVFAEIAPDRLTYLDRRNNVVKLSQGEFITISTLESVYGAHPSIRQIFLYANSSRPYPLAVIVPTDDVLAASAGDEGGLEATLAEALRRVARDAGLQSYETPRGFIAEPIPFTLENGLLTGVRKLARPQLKQRYGPALEALYHELASDRDGVLTDLRRSGSTRPTVQTVVESVRALLGSSADVDVHDAFVDLGGDSLSALTFTKLLSEIFGVDVPVGVIVSPANDLAAIAAHVDALRTGRNIGPSHDRIHGRDAAELRASDLALDQFVERATLEAATALPPASDEVRTVLLTGATGFLGRYLALHWLERMSNVGGSVICLVRARDDAAARGRVDATFDSGDDELLRRYRSLSGHLEVIAGDKGDTNLGVGGTTWQRLADTVDLIVDPAALVNHVLPYRQLFAPNVAGTAELIRLALTTKLKPYVYVSTIGVGDGIAPAAFVEEADIRLVSPTRRLSDDYANGYSNSKWAGEVLLREAHDLCGLPVSVFRCDMILADTDFSGQLNVPDMFTRMVLSMVATGLAPYSFYELGADGRRQRAHFDGLPVGFVAEAISAIGASFATGFRTFHVANPHDDGIGMDTFVDWLVDAGYGLARIAHYPEWITRLEAAMLALPDRQRQASLLPLLHDHRTPRRPLNTSLAPVDRFEDALRDNMVDGGIPHVTAPLIVKYVTDLEILGLLP